MLRSKKITKKQLILNELRKHKDGLTTNQLIKIYYKFSARIWDLQEDGYTIVKIQQVDRRGKATGMYVYRLVENR